VTAPPELPALLAGARPSAAYYAALHTYMEFLANPPQAMAFRGIGRTVPNAVEDLLVMDDENFDTNGIHSTTTDPSRMTIKTDGRYQVIGRLTFASNSTGYRYLEMRVNADGDGDAGGLLARDVREAVSGNVTVLEVVFSRAFVTGDRIEAFGWQNSGAGLALDEGLRKCGVEIRWVGKA
jgi:hypothetical protein